MIKLYYCDINNFGDALTRPLVSKLADSKVVYAGPYSAQIMATGSILDLNYLVRTRPSLVSLGMLKLLRREINDYFNPRLNIWGSGFLEVSPIAHPIRIRKVNVCAVRGRLTRSILEEYGIVSKTQKVAYGDPGLLYPQLIEGPLPQKKWDLGVVAHECDYLEGKYICDQLEKFGYNVQFIYAKNDNPIDVVKSIAMCKKIVSSSLHGCIVADALNIPNRLLLLSYFGRSKDMHLFKYRDYYSAYSKELPLPLEIQDFTAGSQWIANKLTTLLVAPNELVSSCKHDLLASFPYKIHGHW